MALTPITPANLRLGAAVSSAVGVAGETLSPADFVYQAASGKYLKAVNTSALAAAATHFVTTYAALDGNVGLAPLGGGAYLDVSSATFTQGATYVTGDTAGQMFLAGDIGASDFVNIVGVAASTTSLLTFAVSTGLSG
jgi:hypothetical protein